MGLLLFGDNFVDCVQLYSFCISSKWTFNFFPAHAYTIKLNFKWVKKIFPTVDSHVWRNVEWYCSKIILLWWKIHWKICFKINWGGSKKTKRAQARMKIYGQSLALMNHNNNNRDFCINYEQPLVEINAVTKSSQKTTHLITTLVARRYLACIGRNDDLIAASFGKRSLGPSANFMVFMFVGSLEISVKMTSKNVKSVHISIIHSTQNMDWGAP